MAATGCSGKSVPSSVSVSQQKLQEMLARRFPRQFPVAGLLQLDLKAPQLSMVPERNMLNAVIPAELSGKVLKEQYSGLLNVDFALRYEPTDRTLRAYQIKVNQLSMDGLSPALSDMLGTYATALAEQAWARWCSISCRTRIWPWSMRWRWSLAPSPSPPRD